MTAVINRLVPKLGGYQLKKPDSDNISVNWDFDRFLLGQDHTFFEKFIFEHPILDLEYSALCSRLTHSLFDKTKTLSAQISDEELTEQVLSALMLSQLLEHIYRYHLNVPREVQRFQNEQLLFQFFLRQNGFTFPFSDRLAKPPSGLFTRKVRESTAFMNWPRLFSSRIRRLLVTLTAIPQIKMFENFCLLVAFCDKFAAPVLSYFAWLFYVPRLVVNVFLLLKHSIPGFWMQQQEKDIYWLTRLKAQLDRRYFELGNDFVWLIVGLLNCFVLVGALSPAGMYLTITFFLFDALWAGFRAAYELIRIYKLNAEYEKMKEDLLLQDKDASSDEIKELESYQKELQQHYSYEKKRLFLSTATMVALFLGLCFAIPAISVPIVPFIGAFLVVSITLASYFLGKWVEKHKPANKIKAFATAKEMQPIEKFGLFAQKVEKKDNVIEPALFPEPAFS